MVYAPWGGILVLSGWGLILSTLLVRLLSSLAIRFVRFDFPCYLFLYPLPSFVAPLFLNFRLPAR